MLSKIEIFVINKVKEFRLINNLTQADLAYKIDVSSGFIGKIESLKFNSKYNLNHLNKLSKVFNISPKEFLPNNHL